MKYQIPVCDDKECKVEGRHVHNKDTVYMVPDVADAMQFDDYQGEGIHKVAEKPVIDIPKRELFNVCHEMKDIGFQPSRRDDALFFVTPVHCIHQRNLDSLVNEYGRPLSSRVDDLISIPTEADLFHALSGDLEQLTHTNTAGWFAYTNIQAEENAPTLRGQGETPWFALADAWIKIQQWKLPTK